MDKVVHFEIPAQDVDRARAFYEKIFGWHVTPMQEMGYTMLQTGPSDEKTGMPKESAFINGGMFKAAGALLRPIITIQVQDIDAAMEQIKANAGDMVQGKQAVGDMGFSAYFTDCEGNILGLWQSAKKQV